jgi:phytanoyl-CoA hydroxylase
MAKRYKDLSPTEAYNMLMIRLSMVVLDFRDLGSCQRRRIRDSIRIDLQDLEVNAGKLPRGVGYLVVTHNGTESIRICDILDRAGHLDLQYLQGGFQQWESTKLPVETGPLNCDYVHTDNGSAITQKWRLTNAERSSYYSEGYVVLQNVISKDLCESLRSACAELQEEGKSAGDSSHFQLAPTLNGTHEVVRISDPIALREIFWETATSRNIAELVGSLMGNSNVKIHHTKIFLKPPRSAWTIEWHQDFSYFVHTNFDLLAVGIMLDDVSADSGGIRFIPRSHIDGPWNSSRDLGQSSKGSSWKIDLGPEVGDTPYIAPEIHGGGLCIHHCCTAHGSGPNQSDGWRRAFIIQYAGGDNYQIGGRSDYAGWGQFVLGSDPQQVRMISSTFPLPPQRSSRNPRGTLGGQ